LIFLIKPGLVFDTHGHRLGQGYYDRFIANMCSTNDDTADGGGEGKKPVLVGVCLEDQCLEDALHGVVLDKQKY